MDGVVDAAVRLDQLRWRLGVRRRYTPFDLMERKEGDLLSVGGGAG